MVSFSERSTRNPSGCIREIVRTVVFWVTICGANGARGEVPLASREQVHDDPEYWRPQQRELADVADGFLVWESRRENDTWAIWKMKLDGAGLHRLSPEEPGRIHNAAHVSPDGKRLVYLSLPKVDSDPVNSTCPLHLINVDGSDDHVIVPSARKYGWSRCAVWFNDNELAYIDPQMHTYLLNLSTGQKSLIYDGDSTGWLPNTRLTHMAACFNTFSPYDAPSHKINVLPHLGGCQPYFTHDGAWGFWMHGGELIYKMDLATRTIGPIFTGHEMVEHRDHLYCPMISMNRMLMAFVGVDSRKFIQGDGGGYFGCSLSPYQVFLVRLDPDALEPISGPVRYTFGMPCDRFPDVWQATPALGYHSDKAPYSIDMTAPGLTDRAKWDYGDGESGTGAVANHTYEKPGVYLVKARDGTADLRGVVRVRESKPPKATGAVVENENEIVVAFDEPVRLDRARLALESGAAIARWQPADDHRSMRVFLSAKPTANDWLLVDEVSDLSQHPHPMTRARLQVRASPWPVNRKGLAFVFETAEQPNTVRDPVSGQIRAYGQVFRGPSWTNHDNALMLDGGTVYFLGMGESFNNAVRRTHAFSFEITLTPRDLNRANQHVSSYGLFQRGDKLVFECTGKTVDLISVEAFHRYHVVLTYVPGRLIGYVDGKKVVETEAIQDKLEGGWPGADMTVGGDLDDHPWMGAVEGIALYNRILGPDEVRLNHEAYESLLAARPKVPSSVIEAKLTATSKVRLPGQIAPYTRALAVYQYDVTKVISGEFSKKTIRTAHWIVLDNLPQRIGTLPVGATVRMKVEPFEVQRQLQEENISDTIGADTEDRYLAVETARLDPGGPAEWNVLGRYGNSDTRWGDPQPIEGMTDIVHAPVTNGFAPGGIVPRDSDGIVKVGAAFHGGGYGGMGYSIVYVDSPEDRAAVLSLGAVGGGAAWLNGKPVVNVDDFHHYPFCGYNRTPIQLKKGRNELLVKISQQYAFLSFHCDVLTLDGKEMTDLKFSPTR